MKILIIEHERELLFSLSNFLKEGNEVTEAFDGVIAINDFKDETELVIIDEQAPRLPYLEVISILKKKNPALKFIVIIKDAFISTGRLKEIDYIDEFISSPFTTNELQGILSLVNKERKYKELTLIENEFIEYLQTQAYLPYQQIEEMFSHKKDNLYAYVASINSKLSNIKIQSEIEGFKLVKQND